MLLTVLFLSSEIITAPGPTAYLQELGYKLRQDPRSVRSISDGLMQSRQVYLNNDGTEVRIFCRWTMNQGQKPPFEFNIGSKEHFEHMIGDAAVKPKSRELPSGLPPEHSRTFSSISIVRTVLDTKWASVDVTWLTRTDTSPKGYAMAEPFDFSSKASLVERILRKTLANAAGLRLDQNGSSAIAGRSIASARCRRTGRVFGGLTQWAQAENWTLSEDSNYGFLTIKKGAKWAVLPLGADQIKVKGVWKKMGDSAAYFNGKLYLPAAGLEHLRGA